ncbi:MAG TPA: CHAT domain-containing tetratricopeptide repeat protein [Pyrinomonadaceae bacterium]|nr:CHAT domain-containing tetratricopeptide repeat protein [Pyrinomonadaceae bacterium]
MKPKSKSLAYVLSLSLISTIIPGSSFALTARAGSSAPGAAAEPAQQPGAAESLKQGRALLKRGKADLALARLQNALNLFKQAGSPKGVAAANDALGDLYLRQGQYAVAVKYYQDAHDAFGQAAGSQSGVETVLGMPDNEYNAKLMLAKVGEANYRAGKVSEASAAYSQMQVVKPDPSKLTGGVVPKKPSVGSLLGGGGLGGLRPSVPSGGADTAIAAAGAIKGAIELYRQSILYSTHEIGVGRIDYYNGNYDGSRTHFEAALSTAGMPIIGKFGQSRRVRAAARTSLGDIALQQNRPKDAVKFYTEAVKGAREDKRLDLMWPAQRGLGKARWMQAALDKDPKKSLKGREEAVASYREALATIETIRQGSLRADESRTTFLATTKDVYDETSNNLAEMALIVAPTPGAPLEGQALTYAAEAFKVVEQGRARSLLDMLGESGADITAGVPPELLKRKQDNLDRQQEIAQQLTGVAVAEGEEKPDTNKLEAELETLSVEYDNIENQIRAASPRYASLTAPQPLTLAEVQQKVLDDKTALLEYSLGEQGSYMWAVTPASVALFKLPARSAVDGQAQALRAQLIPPKLQRRIAGIDVAEATRGLSLTTDPTAAGPAAAFSTASNALYKTVVEPAAKIVGDKRLLVVADGALNYVPFEALVTSTGPTDYPSLAYLIKTNEVVYAPSASVIAVIRQGYTKPTGKSLLVVADPVFTATDPRAKGAGAAASTQASADTRGLSLSSAVTDVAAPAGATAPATGLQLARLNGTRVEAQQIAQLTRTSGGTADVWLDLEANEAKVTAADMKKYRAVHIATHGLLNTERPQFTGVVLSLVGNKTGDGFVRTDEIFNLNLGSPLVMLSACETGLGKEKRGEGVIGLTRAFMYAGAPTVGVSLWSVADKSTADLMTDFYKRLLASPDASPTASMRAAQIAMIDGKKYALPFYWAPFVLVGEWR